MSETSHISCSLPPSLDILIFWPVVFSVSFDSPALRRRRHPLAGARAGGGERKNEQVRLNGILGDGGYRRVGTRLGDRAMALT